MQRMSANSTASINNEHAEVPYRSSVPVPGDLHEHCMIYIEEQLYLQALNLLNNLLISGSTTTAAPSSTPDVHNAPTFVPPSPTLALLATLVVHPWVTTKSHSAEKLAASNQSLILLNNINNMVGPVNSELSKAFVFVEKKRVSKHRNSTSHANSDDSNAELSDSFNPPSNNLPNSKLAQNHSLWACADDFWHIIGWSFNCAVRFPERWERWKLLLQMMLQILEDDWRERLRLHQENKAPEANASSELLIDSLAAHFLVGCSGNSNGASRRRIMRAIFANGSDKDLSEFREIFRRETKIKRRKSKIPFKSAKQVDIDAGEFGDYFDEAGSDEADEAESETEHGKENNAIQTDHDEALPPKKKPGRPRLAPQNPTPTHHVTSEGTANYGDFEGMSFRRRLLILLSKVALLLPECFTELSDYVDTLEEYMRPLPLDVYSFLICPWNGSDRSHYEDRSQWPPEALSSLLQELARQLVPPSAPRNRDNYLTQEVLEKYYLPFAARLGNSVDNAKLSILVENMVRLLRSHIEMDPRDGGFKRTVHKGIEERNRRVQGNKPKTGFDDTSAKGLQWLEMSSMRLKMLAGVIRDTQ